jgi:hypothetical protein
MEEKIMNIKSRAVLTGVFAAALSLMSVAAPANAADLAVLGIGQGALVGKGAGVEVPVTFVCPADSVDTVLNLEVREDFGNGDFARAGQGVGGFTCTGESQTITVTAIATSKAGAVPLKIGKATAHAILSACPSPTSDCNTVELTTEIKIKNK